MIEWIACKDRMPIERGEHLLYSEKHRAVLGCWPWIPSNDGKSGMWVDLFATPEAGESYQPPLVSHWAKMNHPDGKDE